MSFTQSGLRLLAAVSIGMACGTASASTYACHFALLREYYDPSPVVFDVGDHGSRLVMRESNGEPGKVIVVPAADHSGYFLYDGDGRHVFVSNRVKSGPRTRFMRVKLDGSWIYLTEDGKDSLESASDRPSTGGGERDYRVVSATEGAAFDSSFQAARSAALTGTEGLLGAACSHYRQQLDADDQSDSDRGASRNRFTAAMNACVHAEDGDLANRAAVEASRCGVGLGSRIGGHRDDDRAQKTVTAPSDRSRAKAKSEGGDKAVDAD